MNKEYLVISYYPAPYEGSPNECIAYCDSLEEARISKQAIEDHTKSDSKEFRPIIQIYEAVEIK